MPRYSVRLEIRADRPLTQAQLDALDDLAAGRHQVLTIAEVRARTLSVSLEMDGGDVVGAPARSLNAVLDEVPGQVRHAEVTEMRPRPPTPTRRR